MSSPPTPSSNWYYSAQGHAQGPFTPQQLSELAASGAIVMDTLLWSPGMEEWVTADKLQPEVLPNTSLTPSTPSEVAPAPARKSNLKPIPQVAIPPPSEPTPPPDEESGQSGLFSKLFGRMKKK